MNPTTDTRTTVAIPLFDRFTALDAIGPYEVLQRIPSIDVVFVGHQTGEVRSDNGMLGITRDATFEEVPSPEVLVFPGGFGTRALEHDVRVLDWVRDVHRSALYTTSVCTGSLVLAAAGLLTGRTATSHWSTYAELEAYGVTAVEQRVVEHLDDRIITAAGVSSGIDMALRLVDLLIDRTAAEAAQLMIEYDPAPHVASGSVAATSEKTMARVIEYASVGRR
jgi:putative intracellular protease/amidase